MDLTAKQYALAITHFNENTVDIGMMMLGQALKGRTSISDDELATIARQVAIRAKIDYLGSTSSLCRRDE